MNHTSLFAFYYTLFTPVYYFVDFKLLLANSIVEIFLVARNFLRRQEIMQV